MKFQSGTCFGEITTNDNWVFTISGECKTAKSLVFLAPTTPDLRESLAGSALPFPTEQIAFENTKNQGKLNLINGKFTFSIMRPNAYYINNGSTLIKPHVKIILDEKNIFEIKLGEPIPYRSLKHLPGRPRRTTGR